jgi:hypothetical protein
VAFRSPMIRVESVSSLRPSADRLLTLAAEIARVKQIPSSSAPDDGILEASDQELADYVSEWVLWNRERSLILWPGLERPFYHPR